LKLSSENPVSQFAFKRCNLYRYIETVGTYLLGKRFASDKNWMWIRVAAMTTLLSGVFAGSMVGRCKLNSVDPGRLKAPGFNP
jgi:hypothetical protein